MRAEPLARLQVVGAAALFSTGGAAIKGCALSSWQVAGLRSLVAAVVLSAFLPEARRGLSRGALAVGVAYAATMVLYALANKLTTAANTIFLQSSAPVYVLLLGPWLLRERVRRGDVAFLAIVGTGLVLFFVGYEAPLRTAPDPALGNALALLAGVTWALTIVGLRWLGRSEARRGGAAASVVLGNAVAFLACLPGFGVPASSGVVDWLLVLYLGACQIGLAYVLLTAGLRHLPALEASLLLLVEPVLNPLWAWLFHREVPGGWALAGGALILSATALKSARDARRVRALPGGQSV